jgi:hypothetical protein
MEGIELWADASILSKFSGPQVLIGPLSPSAGKMG